MIRLGAVPVTCAGNVLELFGLTPVEPSTESLGEAARALLEPPQRRLLVLRRPALGVEMDELQRVLKRQAREV